MSKRKIFKFAFTSMIFVISFFNLACNGEKVFQASFINGTGKTITGLTLAPAAESDSKKSDSQEEIFNIPLDLQDKGIAAIDLPQKLKKCDSLSLEIQFEDGKSVTTKKKETISFSADSSENVFLLSLKGKKSSVPLVSAGVAGGTTAATIAGAAATAVATWGAGGLTYYLALIGSVVGGGMAAGVAVVAAVPLAITGATFGTVYAIQHIFSHDTLLIQKVTKDKAVLLPEESKE